MAGSRAAAMAADGLTLGRGVLALVIGTLAARGQPGGAAVALSAAWFSDALDGRVARASGRRTRLGEWDMPADTLVGAALLAGLWAEGTVPPWLAGGILLIFGGGYVLLRQAALGMVVQAVGYGAFLGHLWSTGQGILWVPVVAALLIGALDRRKLFRVLIPAFLGGLGDALRLRRGSRLGPPADPR
ncbi:MAG: CDP-alcohol phosphatidyltransferase family protein [Actinomycetota bacterium]